ncbi:WD40 repeat-like protein, partial [Suillus hirtellus]
VRSVSFSPNGTRIVSSSDDRTIRLWDAVMGKPIGQPLRGHTSWVTSVSFSPDGTRIISGSSDGTVRVWYAAIGKSLQDHAEEDYDGWMTGPNRRLLFWVPPASRSPFYNPWTAFVIPRGVELDLSRMAHGTRWQQCYE